MAGRFFYLVALVQSTAATTLDSLTTKNINPNSVSVSGFSSGGYMAAQLGIAHSELFKSGFGVFAGGPYDCGRDQDYTTCLFNNTPSIEQPLANMLSWSGSEIDCLCNLKQRKVYIQAGTADDVVGLGIARLLESQLSHFTDPSNAQFVTSVGAAHVFPTDLDGQGNSACNQSALPYIANCGYDGAGEVLKWLYGNGLKPRSERPLSGSILPFRQTGIFGAPGLAETAFVYVPEKCQQGGKTACKLHVALHGCGMHHEHIGDKFLVNTGYNLWADTNEIVVLYPQTTVDNGTYPTWSGNLSNLNACFDWIGQYGESDWKTGDHMKAIVNMVRTIIGHKSEPGPFISQGALPFVEEL
ncbi:hypothetical protein M409DRAFT_26304 [Zasmidium cellare ATCC 36951]|uniref:Uncharacterized protein n=1 Tax=Zasmidium cellare ATCC 36951 TaxID=1080233 RepID=A0A6A6CAL0_ZASCE|nr:uncharacterized protein M409DRAFT_26304 [Zasmidium cellare ATCC 36951]KAF2163260.1 hypothetical protein M409DRAFT_26304 [Zasmidium cellare ATCC 36951]